MERTLEILLKLKDDASKQLDSFKSKTESAQASFKKMATVGTAVFAGVTAIAYKGVQAYAEVERSNRQLEHAIIGVSKGTKEQVTQVQAITSALQKKAGVDADAVNMGVAQLSTFGLQSQSVIDLTKSLADLTVNQNGLNASGEQYVSSANIIAKAMRGEFGMLQKMGIRFTETQQKMIEFGTESEKVSALQEGLAQNLRETTDTVEGIDLAMALFKRNTEDISESIGKALLPAFNSLMERVAPLIEKFAVWAEENPKLFASILLITGGLGGLLAVIGLIGLALPPLLVGLGLISLPIIAGVLAIGSMIAFIVTLIKHWDMVKEGAQALLDYLSAIFLNIKTLIMTVGLSIIKAFDDAINWVKNAWSSFWSFIGDFAKKQIDNLLGWLDPLIKKFERAFSLMKELGGNVKAGIKVVSEKISGKSTAVNDALISPNGNIITTHPDDYLIATKNPASLGGGGSGLTINISGNSFMGEEDMAEKVGNKIINILKYNARI